MRPSLAQGGAPTGPRFTQTLFTTPLDRWTPGIEQREYPSKAAYVAALDALKREYRYPDLLLALMNAKTQELTVATMDWMRDRLERSPPHVRGTSPVIAFAYANNFLRFVRPFEAVAWFRYATIALEVDRFWCADKSAVDGKLTVLAAMDIGRLAHAKHRLSPADRAETWRIARSLEEKTFPLRGPDRWLCLGGMAMFDDALANTPPSQMRVEESGNNRIVYLPLPSFEPPLVAAATVARQRADFLSRLTAPVD